MYFDNHLTHYYLLSNSPAGFIKSVVLSFSYPYRIFKYSGLYSAEYSIIAALKSFASILQSFLN